MDGFQIVKHKSRKRKQQDFGTNFADAELVIQYTKVDTTQLFLKVVEAQDKLRVSNYLKNLIRCLEVRVQNVDHVLCYGLGSFNESYISRHQLAALLAIKEHYNCDVSVSDPIFNPDEIDVLTKLDLKVLGENDEAKLNISSFGKSLVYFAHCSSQLVNNFLWANWNDHLHNCAILSNGFSIVTERNDEQTMNSLSCIRDVVKIAKEYRVENIYEVSDVFNDLSIHVFPSSKLNNAEFWDSRPEPAYEGHIIEFCKKGVVVTLEQVT